MSRTLILLASLLAVIAVFLMLREKIKDPQRTEPSIVTPQTAAKLNNLNFHEWHEFASEQSDFKVLLPSLPQHVSDIVTDPATKQPQKFETYAAVNDSGSAYFINVITFASPGDAEASEEALKSTVTNMLIRNKENKINSMNMGSLHGDRALDFALDNHDILIKGKVVPHGNKIYIISMVNKQDTFNSKEFEFFINSFNFVNKD